MAPSAASFTGNQPGLQEQIEMVRNLRLAEAKQLFELTRSEILSTRPQVPSLAQKVEHLKPDRIAQSFSCFL